MKSKLTSAVCGLVGLACLFAVLGFLCWFWFNRKDDGVFLIRVASALAVLCATGVALFKRELEDAKYRPRIRITAAPREEMLNTCPGGGAPPYNVYCHHLKVENSNPHCEVRKCSVRLVTVRPGKGFAAPRLMEWTPAEVEPHVRSFTDEEVFDFGQSRVDHGTFELNTFGRFHSQVPKQGGTFDGDCPRGQTREYIFKITAENYISSKRFTVKVTVKDNPQPRDTMTDSPFKTDIEIIE